MAKAIMFQGAGSNVGKSLVVAGLSRAFRNRGLSVAPFKPQNMSNNAAVTTDGGEIGRAQALQALAAGRPPHSDMNPVLLKPESETGAQVIVQGQRLTTMKARDFGTRKQSLLAPAIESFQRLSRSADLIVVEGAGSPAEINLRAGDIANMGFAEAADLPVALIGDIDRGGVIAQMVGTQAVLAQSDACRIKGFAINKFRGDVGLFGGGLAEIVARTGWPSLGVIPWFDQAWRLPAEDVLDVASSPGGALKIAVPRLSRIANFDDLDPLSNEPGVCVEIIEPGRPLPGDAQLVLIPGSKSTIADLAFFRAQGWDIDLHAHIRRGGRVLGICGGYQMLGTEISDPDGLEGPACTVSGLGHLEVQTVMKPEKRLALTRATYLPSGDTVEGYEIHIGETTGPDCRNAWLRINGQPQGAGTANGQVRGAYLHGLFGSDSFRHTCLQEFGAGSALNYTEDVDNTLNALARHLEDHMDLDLILSLAQTPAV